MTQFAFATVLKQHRPFIEDPCGFGIKIFYRSANSAEFQAWLREEQAQSPLYGPLQAKVQTIQGRKLLHQMGRGGFRSAGKLSTEEMEKLLDESVMEAANALAEQYEVTPGDILKMATDTAIEKAVRLASDWAGVEGKENGATEDSPLACSEDNLRQFFAFDAPISSDQSKDWAGQPFGAVMAKLVVDAAERTALVEAVQGEVAKNVSGAITDGASPSPEETPLTPAQESAP